MSISASLILSDVLKQDPEHEGRDHVRITPKELAAILDKHLPNASAFELGERVVFTSMFGHQFNATITGISFVARYDAKLDDGCKIEGHPAESFTSLVGEPK